MAKQIVNIGAVANDGSGDPLRTAFDKVNDNFNELYTSLGGNSLFPIVNNQGEFVRTGANKISFNFANLNVLPTPSSYKGMLAYVDTEKAVYYSNGSEWLKLLSDNSTEIENYTDSLSSVAYSGSLFDLNGGIVDGQNGQILSTNGDGTLQFIDPPAGGVSGESQNVFSTILADTGSTVANSTNDTLTIVGGDTITTSITGDTLTISGMPSFTAIATDSGQAFALNNQEITIAGGTGISTSFSGDTITINATGSSSGSGATREEQTVQTSPLASGASANIQFDQLGLSYALYKVEVDGPCRVRIYSDNSSRVADASRAQGSDPAEGSGVIAEFISSGATTFKVTPAIFGWLDGQTTIPVAVTNNASGTATISVKLSVLKLETA